MMPKRSRELNFRSGTASDPASSFFSAASAATADVGNSGVARVIYDSTTGNLYYDSDGGGTGNRTLFATVNKTNAGDTFDFNDIWVGP